MRQHDITGRHIDSVTIHDGVDIVGGIERETQGSRCVPMRTRGLARLDHLVGCDDAARRSIQVRGESLCITAVVVLRRVSLPSRRLHSRRENLAARRRVHPHDAG